MSTSIVEASIVDLQAALADGTLTSVELTAKYILRAQKYDFQGLRLNSIVKLNPKAFTEAQESDLRRDAGNLKGPLDGVPYTLKDSMKYAGETCATGSPALADLVANEDCFLVQQLRAAGAVCIGRTNTPPMMASGMHRGLYGRAESPYNLDYLTAAFSSGSSNGSGTSTAASFAAFGLGSETVSSGRSPASNNGLVAYTPSRTVISPVGIWPLYPTCDVVVPHTRTVQDMLTILDVLTIERPTLEGDFWREQTYVQVPKVTRPVSHLDLLEDGKDSLKGKRLAVPKMYIGEHDPLAKPTFVSDEVIALYRRAKADLEALGAIVIETGFPLVTNYEDDSISGQPNNVVGFAPDWNGKERRELVAYLWDDFLLENGDPNYAGLASVDGSQMFPRPAGYIPDQYMETKNFMDYPGLVELAKSRDGKQVWDIDGIAEALPAVEAQRKRDLEDWMDENNFDAVIFPANGDVGRADLDTNDESARHALQNGVKYSNGNRALRHMGVPTVSVTMGMMVHKKMPANLTFAGKHGQDSQLLQFAYAYEQATHHRIAPPLTPALDTDVIPSVKPKANERTLRPSAREAPPAEELSKGQHQVAIETYVDGAPSASHADMLSQQAGSETATLELSMSGNVVQPPKPLYGGYSTHVGKANGLVIGYTDDEPPTAQWTSLDGVMAAEKLDLATDRTGSKRQKRST
ncbi:hypothetical protein B0A48_09213 [Cryoendolithus antarcticus]|uniref:Amidase domain-containing protein n=1 Tax=Cryoendolithus antarcticus TaxID=1507870 RepID=A0A1V8T2C1_9PEZI|nr:hypothetical protein B0A48_09213 [Cryoendolithus antarcticus]